jgi:HK97 family phage portal protein
VRQCRVALGLSQSLAEHAATFFENGARPTGVLRVPHGNREALEHVREAWSSRHAGARNAHRIAVVSGEVQFEAITGPLDDLQFVEQRHLSTAEIARIFRIPPWMLGHQAAPTA